jgi:hypothetical protein
MHDDTLDRLGRRKRFAPPVKRLTKATGQPVSIVPTEADICSFLAYNDHGPLPTSYVYELVKHLRKDRTNHIKRQGMLVSELTTIIDENGKKHKGTYLELTKEQKRALLANWQEQVRHNGPLAQIELKKRGYWVYPTRIDHELHRMMNGAITGSLHIAANEHGLGYVSLRDIVTRHTCPEKTRNSPSPLKLTTSVGITTPDELCGISYPTAPKTTYRFLAFEQDRASEQREFIRHKFRCYIEVFKRHQYEDAWGITNLFVCFVTTRPIRMANLIADLEEETKNCPHLREFFLFKCKPQFSGEWITPPVMTDLLTDPWERAALPPLFLDRV